MATKDSLGDRMKEFYENRAKHYLPRKVPVMIRLDGRSFHSFTKGFYRPYDEVFHNAMNATLLYLCKNIQGCKFGYTQSDEISLVLIDLDTLTTDGWFDYGVQKMCSVAASMATLEFNRQFREQVSEWYLRLAITEQPDNLLDAHGAAYDKAINRGAMFDARVFSIPEEEVANAFIWRQQDATRNAIQMLGQAHFSHKQLEGRSCNDIQDMLFLEKNINFNDMPIEFKRGVCCYRKEVPCIDRLIGYKKEWILDKECPIFSQDRNYIEQHIQRKDS